MKLFTAFRYILFSPPPGYATQACDEYGNCDCNCQRSWCENSYPYYCTNNINCHNCSGYDSCIMGNGSWKKSCICAWTALQIGWGTVLRNSLSVEQCHVAMPISAMPDWNSGSVTSSAAVLIGIFMLVASL